METATTGRPRVGSASIHLTRRAIFGIHRSLLRTLAVLGTASLVAAAIAPAALADSGGDSNKGDVWVLTANASPGAGHAEDSHLPCADFNIFGSNMADSHGTFSLLLWPPSGSKQRVYSAVWNYSGSGAQKIANVSIQQLRSDVVAAGGSANSMHLRLDLAQDPGKHKMFWIDCSASDTQAVDDDRSGPDAQDAADNAGTNDNDSSGPDAQDAADNAGTSDNDSSGPDAQDAADSSCDNDSSGPDAQDSADSSGNNTDDNDAGGPDTQDAADNAGTNDNDCAGPDAQDAADTTQDNDSSGPDAQDAADNAGTNDNDSSGPDAQDAIDNAGGVEAASVTVAPSTTTAATAPVRLAQTGGGAGAVTATAGNSAGMPQTGRTANLLLLALPLPLLALGTMLVRTSRSTRGTRVHDEGGDQTS